jgi:hypothetical protein
MRDSSIIALLLGLVVIFSACRPTPGTRFKLLDPAASGTDFSNEITGNDTLNIRESEFVYNGAGVAVGDLNGDGLDDLFCAGNQVAFRLYLNRGGLKQCHHQRPGGPIRPSPNPVRADGHRVHRRDSDVLPRRFRDPGAAGNRHRS